VLVLTFEHGGTGALAKLTFLGQSAFYVEGSQHNVLIDPFITSNPLAQAAGIKADQFQPHGIVLSHGHLDHIEDAAAIAKQSGAKVVASYELANYMLSQGAPDAMTMNPGGPMEFSFGKVRLTNAIHSSSHDGVYLGPACGIVLTTDDGLTIYHAGDTDLFSDMSLIGKMDQPDVAILPIGSVFTMDPDQAVEAAKLVQAKVVIPMHYNTWPAIEQDVQAFKVRVEAETPSQVVILDAGEFWISS